MRQIKKHCFQFMQNVLTNDPAWIPSTRQCIGGRFVQRNGGYISTSIAPPTSGSYVGYNTRWASLTKKVLLLLKKYDKTMAKSIDCECQLEPSLLFEFSLTCTILEEVSTTTFSVLNNWYVDVRRNDSPSKKENDSQHVQQPTLISWQCYDSCHGGNSFLDVLGKSGKLIKMLCDEDEHDYVRDKLQLQMFIRRGNDDKRNLHTFANLDRDITLDSTILFCYRGLPPEEGNCTCHPHVLHRVTFFKSLDDDDALPKNGLILGSWPFPHDPFDQVPAANIVVVTTNDDQQQQNDPLLPPWCSCLEMRDICHQACDVQLVTTLPQA